MALPSRKYIPLPQVAEILNCSIEDIIHWGANGATRIGIPYESHTFDPPHIIHETDLNQLLEDYRGFAFIFSGDLFNAELDGHCTFNSLGLTDGRAINFMPTTSEWVRYRDKGFEFSQLFMRIEELEELQAKLNNSINKPLADKERESLIKIIHALATNGYKYPRRGALAEMIEDFEKNKNGVSENTLTKYLKEFDSL